MKPFSFSTALSLILALAPVAAFADDGAPPTAPPQKDAVEIVEDAPAIADPVRPTLDIVFCIDVSGSMGGYMPVIKPTILGLIRRAVESNPGRTLRLGLVRYGDGADKHFVLDLTEDKRTFLENLRDTRSLAVGTEFVGDVIKKSVQELKWSDNSVRQIYVLGNESVFQGPVTPEEALKLARSKSVRISTSYCDALRTSRPQASDLLNVGTWFTNDWNLKSGWIELARLGGGEYIQVVSENGDTPPGYEPLLAVVWDGPTAVQFADYVSGPTALKERFDQSEFLSKVRSQQTPGVSARLVFPPVAHSVTRFYDMNPDAATSLIRP